VTRLRPRRGIESPGLGDGSPLVPGSPFVLSTTITSGSGRFMLANDARQRTSGAGLKRVHTITE
jgi:hypothetical protein